MERHDWIMAVVALGLGFVIGMIDTSPGWDDTGISAAIVLTASTTFGALRPSRAWLWAIAVGAPIVMLNIIGHHNYGSLIVLVFAFAGAYAGAVVRKVVTQENRA